MLIKEAENVTFVFVPPAGRGFRSVAVAGDFNKWNPAAGPMAPAPDGSWRTTLTLPPGDYQFRYCADGQWFNDPNADGEVPNQFGGRNCLARIVRPAPAPPPPAPAVTAAPPAPPPPAPPPPPAVAPAPAVSTAPPTVTAAPAPAPVAAEAPVVAAASVPAPPPPMPVIAEPVAAEPVAAEPPPAPVPTPAVPQAPIVAEAPAPEPPATVGAAVAEAAPPRTSAAPAVALAFRPSASDPVFEDGDDEKPDFSLLFRWNPAKAAVRPKAEAARPKVEARNGGPAGDGGADPLVGTAGDFAAWWGRFNPPEG